MSKERARARAERERLAAEQSAARATERARRAQAAARRARREARWRHLRLWRHGRGFQRRREAWGLFVTILALCLFLAYLLTGSVAAVAGTALILLIVAPVLWALLHARN